MFNTSITNKIVTHKALIILGLSILITVISIGLLGDSVKQFLRYDSLAISDQKEYWRLFSAHFTHLGWSHLWLNLAGLAMIFIFFTNCVSVQYWIVTFIVSSLSISALIFIFNPEIRWYVGLSGVLHALFIVGGIADIKKRKWEGIVFTAIILAKVFYEQLTGPLPGSEDAAGGPVLVDAHFYGAMTGALLSTPILWRLWKNRS